MKIYIPFNSNDFNSVFATLTVSPLLYIQNRSYSYKRGTLAKLNCREDIIIGFKEPIFHGEEYDNDEGYPLLLKLDLSVEPDCLIRDDMGFEYVVISKTLHMFEEFSILFRSKSELDDTFLRARKSLETKYIVLAKSNSSVCENYVLTNTFPSFNNLPKSELDLNQIKEGELINKMLGVILGSSIASVNQISSEWKEISTYLTRLKNQLILYLDDHSSQRDYWRIDMQQTLVLLCKAYESVENIDEVIVRDHGWSSNDVVKMKELSLFGQSVYQRAIDNVIKTVDGDLPVVFAMRKMLMIASSNFNANSKSSIVELFVKTLRMVEQKINAEITNLVRKNKFSPSELVHFKEKHGDIKLKIPFNLPVNETEYLEQAIMFFLFETRVTTADDFFQHRDEILIGLAKYFRKEISSFIESNERDYLLVLLNSFQNPALAFDVRKINNDVVRSIAILFISGRDLLKYIEVNEKFNIIHSGIYLSLWGAIYGAASIPKTITENSTNLLENCKALVRVYNQTLKEFATSNCLCKLNYSTDSYKVDKGHKSESGFVEKTSSHSMSEQSRNILQVLQREKKVRLSTFINKKKYSTLKSNKDINDLINREISSFVDVVKEKRVLYAVLR